MQNVFWNVYMSVKNQKEIYYKVYDWIIGLCMTNFLLYGINCKEMICHEWLENRLICLVKTIRCKYDQYASLSHFQGRNFNFYMQISHTWNQKIND